MSPRFRSSLLCLLLALPSLAQPPATAAPNQVDAQGRKQGEWSKTWPDGTVRYTGQFKDDKPVGAFKHYDEEGRLAAVQRHAGDGRVSRTELLHRNGKVMAAGKYVGQEKDSTWNYYDQEGHIVRVERYKMGKLHGEQAAHYPDGGLVSQEHYVDGVRHGESRAWFAGGAPQSSATYVKDQPEGTMTWWFPNGRKEAEGKMVKGLHEGWWTFHNEDGSVRMRIQYAAGEVVKEKRENGAFTDLFPDERPKCETTYKAGKREGPFTEYHDNGKWVLKPVPPDPVKGYPSDMERVLQGQTKKREGKYRNDLLEGEVKEYDERGKLVKVVKYVAGVEQ